MPNRHPCPIDVKLWLLMNETGILNFVLIYIHCNFQIATTLLRYKYLVCGSHHLMMELQGSSFGLGVRAVKKY